MMMVPAQGSKKTPEHLDEWVAFERVEGEERAFQTQEAA